MTDAGLISAMLMLLTWLEWRDWRRQWAWEKSQTIANEQKRLDTEALLAKQGALMAEFHKAATEAGDTATGHGTHG